LGAPNNGLKLRGDVSTPGMQDSSAAAEREGALDRGIRDYLGIAKNRKSVFIKKGDRQGIGGGSRAKKKANTEVGGCQKRQLLR